jgi:hypothetical protein
VVKTGQGRFEEGLDLRPLGEGVRVDGSVSISSRRKWSVWARITIPTGLRSISWIRLSTSRDGVVALRFWGPAQCKSQVLTVLPLLGSKALGPDCPIFVEESNVTMKMTLRDVRASRRQRALGSVPLGVRHRLTIIGASRPAA